MKANCVQCHGEGSQRDGELDLRLRRLIVAGGESGPAVLPGNSKDSLLMQRVRAGEMPPGDRKPLTAQEIETIQRWIQQGAKTARNEPERIGETPHYTQEEREYWAFQPINQRNVPRVRSTTRDCGPIDRFLLEKLESQSLSYADDAPSHVLLRRAAFNLTGLPATPDQYYDFVNDQRPDAFERTVDRLLASPHYGERWGRHWLDVAGYADSEGYADEDRPRAHAWRFRDYIIRAFNADKPFDQFIIEQLAGDELVSPDYSKLTPDAIEKLTATGFLRMAPDGTASSGIDQNLARNQVMADTLHIVGTSLLGMTVQCSQCHDHRYDPIPQLDYYRLRAIFEPALNWKNWRTPPSRRVSLYTDSERKLRDEIEAEASKVDAARQEKVDFYISRTLEQELLLVPDELQGKLRMASKTKAKDRTDEQKTLLQRFPSIANINGGSLYLYERRREPRAKDIEAKRAEKERQFIAEIVATTPNADVSPETLPRLRPDAAKMLQVYTDAAEEIRKTQIKKHLQEFSDKAAAIRKKIPRENFIRVLNEVPGKIPATFVFHRGDHDQPKEQVAPGSLSILDLNENIPSDDSSVPTSGRRLSFARHLTDDRHPLVPRVVVNRLWMHHFGRGIVNSPGDFGVLGERPTHPELLDWLASEFVRHDWSAKAIHRQILVSTAYRQSSIGDAKSVETDPENRLYGRMSMRRLESETLRDAILAVSGTLNHKLFGEPVPVMEDEVGQIVIGKENLDGERKPTNAIPLHGEEFRRSLYVQVRRSRPLAVLESFDSPAMTPNCKLRRNSTVAPQSLMLMNSNFAISFADSFAQRLMVEEEDESQQIVRGWWLAFGSSPSEDDIVASQSFIKSQQTAIRETTPDLDERKSYQQALASFCHVLFSSNRFVYVE